MTIAQRRVLSRTILSGSEYNLARAVQCGSCGRLYLVGCVISKRTETADFGGLGYYYCTLHVLSGTTSLSILLFLPQKCT